MKPKPAIMIRPLFVRVETESGIFSKTILHEGQEVDLIKVSGKFAWVRGTNNLSSQTSTLKVFKNSVKAL